MQNPDDTPIIVEKPWARQLEELLAQAADLGILNGLDADAFMKRAWQAFIDARPGLREYLEEMQLRTQIDELRKLGRLAEA